MYRLSWRRIALIGPVFALLSGSALAADAANGRVLANQVCGLCHLSAAGNGPRAGVAPPFPVVATERLRNSNDLRPFLRAQNHPFGASFLSDQQIDDLTAYVQSLRN
ncbi:MAG: cytochrome c [Alphaproteobacteria bacterium]|nr:cytochrome c [Alphaproteobacteria bacterium]